MKKGKSFTDRSCLRIFLLCFIAYSFSYIGRMNFSACLPSMVSSGIFDKAFGGYIATAYLVCYGCGQLVNGFLSNRIFPGKMIGIGLCGVATCNFLMGAFGAKYVLLIIWALNGFFNSMLWTPIIRAFAEWLPDNKRERAGVNIAVSIPAGTIVAYIIPALVLRFCPWNTVFMVCGAMVAFAAILWICGVFSLKDYLDSLKCKQTEEKDCKESTVAVSDNKVSTFKAFMSTALFAVVPIVFINGILKEAVTQWTPTYLYDSFGISESLSSLFSAVLPFISIFGTYIAKWIDKKFCNNEVLTCGVMFGISSISNAILVLTSGGHAIFAAILIAISVSAMWGVNSMLLTFIPFHFRKVRLSSSVSGTLNCLIYASSSVFTSASGKLAGISGWNSVIVFWLCSAIIGVVLSVVFSRVWGKKRSIYEQS